MLKPYLIAEYTVGHLSSIIWINPTMM